MSRVHPYIRHHRPLITPRIEFDLAPRPALPVITQRISFATSRLVRGGDVHAGETEVYPQEEEEDGESDESDPEIQANAVPQEGSARIPRTASFVLRAQSLPAPPQVARYMIPKPRGEPGRPNSGGFTLEAELKRHGWVDADIGIFMAEIRRECKDRLNFKAGIRSQPAGAVQGICDLMSAANKWPILQNYENCWPVRSALKLALKYGAEAAKKTEVKKVTKRIRNALNAIGEDDL